MAHFYHLKQRYCLQECVEIHAWGRVYLGEDSDRPGSPPCTIRYFPCPVGHSSEWWAQRQQEALTFEQLGHHPRIIPLLAYLEDPQGCYFIHDTQAGPSLEMALQSSVPWTAGQSVQFLRQVLELLAFIHQEGWIHGALSAERLVYRAIDQQWVVLPADPQQTDTARYSSHQIAPPSNLRFGYRPLDETQSDSRSSHDLAALGQLVVRSLCPSDSQAGGWLEGRSPNPNHICERLQHSPIADSPVLIDILCRLIDTTLPNRFESAQQALNAVHRLQASCDRYSGHRTDDSPPYLPEQSAHSSLEHPRQDAPVPHPLTNTSLPSPEQFVADLDRQICDNSRSVKLPSPDHQPSLNRNRLLMQGVGTALITAGALSTGIYYMPTESTANEQSDLDRTLSVDDQRHDSPNSQTDAQLDNRAHQRLPPPPPDVVFEGMAMNPGMPRPGMSGLDELVLGGASPGAPDASQPNLAVDIEPSSEHQLELVTEAETPAMALQADPTEQPFVEEWVTDAALESVINTPSQPSIYMWAPEVLKTALGDNFPAIIDSLLDLAEQYHQEHQMAAATYLYQEALSLQVATLGNSHPDVVKTQIRIAALLMNDRDAGAIATSPESAFPQHQGSNPSLSESEFEFDSPPAEPSQSTLLTELPHASDDHVVAYVTGYHSPTVGDGDPIGSYPADPSGNLGDDAVNTAADNVGVVSTADVTNLALVSDDISPVGHGEGAIQASLHDAPQTQGQANTPESCVPHQAEAIASPLGMPMQTMGEFAISIDANQTIWVWHAETKNLRCVLDGHRSPVISIELSPGGEMLQSSDLDVTHIWNLNTGELMYTFSAPESV